MRLARRAGALALVAVVTLAGAAGAAGNGAGSPAFEAPFAHPPLDPPLVLTGDFGEARSGRYHGGLDFSTGGGIGRPVYAPLAGWIERVRTSGSGFGRSIYLHADDGRLLVFGHLDAFDEPLASFVDEAQAKLGEYEQDLWPGRDRFRVAPGERMAWTGESGAGPAHLHLEVRRGDVAYNPLRAGVVADDETAPVLRRLTLEPLDAGSFVERSPSPWSGPLGGGAAETLLVEGRVRAIVEAKDGANGNGLRLAPWATGVSFGGLTVACQFDSATWGGDMADADYVYDHGRAGPGNGVVLWFAGRFRPTVIVGGYGAPDGAIEVRAGDPPRPLEVSAVDVSGRRATAVIWLRGPRADERGPDTSRTGPPAARHAGGSFEWSVLPGRHLRVALLDAPAGSRGVRVCGAPAVWRAGHWVVIVPFDSVLATPPGAAAAERTVARLEAGGVDAAGAPWLRAEHPYAQTDDGPRWSFSPAGPFEWWLAADAVFEPALIARERGPMPAGTSELVPVSEAWSLAPADLPLRADVRLRFALPAGAAPGRVDVYRAQGRGWDALGAAYDSSARAFEAGTRTLGRFALMADTLAPRVRLFRPRTIAARPVRRWSFEARVSEAGSGVDRRRSWIEVDGRREPTEWDAERARLRWRPPRAPARGNHAVEVVVTDLAGNVRRERGSFVIN